MSDVVSYRLDEDTEVEFEIEDLPAGFRPASTSSEAVDYIHSAVRPAVEAAKVVLEQVKRARPQEVEVKFGVKVSGTANWIVAKAATDANFEIKLIWRPDGAPDPRLQEDELPEEPENVS